MFVASKGRPRNTTTSLLVDDGIRPWLVVEPQDAAAYRRVWGDSVSYLILEESDRGLAYARNAIHDLCADGLAPGWYWSLDDDIEGWSKVADQRCYEISPTEALRTGQDIIEFKMPVHTVEVSMEYRQAAWRHHTPWSAYRHVDVVVAINAAATKGIRYDETLPIGADRDFALQCLHAGKVVTRLNWLAFATPQPSTNRGGLFDAYRSKTDKQHCDTLMAKWGRRYAEMKWSDTMNQWRVSVNWREFEPYRRHKRMKK